MKEDKIFVVLFISLLAILVIGLFPREPTTASSISTAAISLPAESDLLVSGIIIAVIVIAVGAYFFLARRSKFKSLVSESPMEKPRMPIEKPSTHKQKLKNYIQLSVKQGKSKSQIRHTLMAVGWPNEDIDKALREI